MKKENEKLSLKDKKESIWKNKHTSLNKRTSSSGVTFSAEKVKA